VRRWAGSRPRIENSVFPGPRNGAGAGKPGNDMKGSIVIDFFWYQVFDNIEQRGFPEGEIEITVIGNGVYFSWNDEAIQALAEALGETEFPEPRPCG